MSLEKIRLREKEIILIGTAHISKASVDLVNQTIIEEKPQLVGIELDEQRAHQLQNQSKWQNTNIRQVMQEGRTNLLLLNILLSNLQRKLGESVQVKPGQEMLVAAQTASQNKIPVVLLDRNIDVTLKRAFSLTPVLEKLKILSYFIAGTFSGEQERLTPDKIEALKQTDMVTQLIQELGQKAPTIKKVLVDERDAYIATQIQNSVIHSSPEMQKMVCVVGAGHLQGIKKRIEEGEQANLAELMQLPPPSLTSQLIKWIVPLLLALLVIWAFWSQGIESVLSLAAYWILITGGFSAIGALIARAHPIAILTAFIAAPLTTIHPLLASGWFAALVETKYRHPQVKDFEALNKLNSYADFERNKVTHILMVAAYTNLGSTIGVVVALPVLASLVV